MSLGLGKDCYWDRDQGCISISGAGLNSGLDGLCVRNSFIKWKHGSGRAEVETNDVREGGG